MAARGLSSLPLKIKQRDIATLHTSFLKASTQFSSYNFREYFIRRSNVKFEKELPDLLGCTKRIDDTVLENLNEKIQDKLRFWWSSSRDELSVLERASLMNQLFEAPKLVVEGATNNTMANLPNSNSVTDEAKFNKPNDLDEQNK